MSDQEKQRTLAFNSAHFIKSSSRLSNCPPDQGIEVAFAGRSNAGKSSAINTITQNKKLARTSKTPGRTQLINFFGLNLPDKRLVDLPGYGFAKVSLAMKEEWQQHLDAYLRERQSLAGLVLVMDIRNPLTEFDQAMCQWCREAELPLLILLTKADKLKFGPAKSAALKVRKLLKDHDNLIAVQLFSSLKKSGVEEARSFIQAWLEPEDSEEAPTDQE